MQTTASTGPISPRSCPQHDAPSSCARRFVGHSPSEAASLEYASAEEVPLIVWLNGGPGASSMTGMMSENGAYSIQPDGALARNPTGWNHVGHMLSWDQVRQERPRRRCGAWGVTRESQTVYLACAPRAVVCAAFLVVMEPFDPRATRRLSRSGGGILLLTSLSGAGDEPGRPARRASFVALWWWGDA